MPKSDEEMITITREEYELLQERSRWLSALEAAGVDGTEAFVHAQDMMEEWDAE